MSKQLSSVAIALCLAACGDGDRIPAGNATPEDSEGVTPEPRVMGSAKEPALKANRDLTSGEDLGSASPLPAMTSSSLSDGKSKIRLTDKMLDSLASKTFSPRMTLKTGRELGITAREEKVVNSALHTAWKSAKGQRLKLIERPGLQGGVPLVLPRLHDSQLDEIRAEFRDALPGSIARDTEQILIEMVSRNLESEFGSELLLTLEAPPPRPFGTGNSSRETALHPESADSKYILVTRLNGETERVDLWSITPGTRFDYLDIDSEVSK